MQRRWSRWQIAMTTSSSAAEELDDGWLWCVEVLPLFMVVVYVSSFLSIDIL
jgi:hypothetical protein